MEVQFEKLRICGTRRLAPLVVLQGLLWGLGDLGDGLAYQYLTSQVHAELQPPRLSICHHGWRTMGT